MKLCQLIWLPAFINLAAVLSSRGQVQPAAGVAATNAVPASVHPLKAPGIENFYQVSDKVFSGSAPEGDAAFAALKERGIKTIVSVDGAKPDVEMAKKYGLRYVHLPFGYDGIPADQSIRLAKASKSLPGPFYIHCHHGLHRGPAGVAVVCMAMDGWSAGQAQAWMKLAGTATNYSGLYKSVEQFHPPSPGALNRISTDFPEVSKVSPLAEQMIAIDQHMDNLKLIKLAGYQKPDAHPDLDPAHEALMFHELFKELLRSPVMEKHNQDFRFKMTATEEAANTLHLSLRITPFDPKRADTAFQRINDSCAACHKVYRN